MHNKLSSWRHTAWCVLLAVRRVGDTALCLLISGSEMHWWHCMVCSAGSGWDVLVPRLHLIPHLCCDLHTAGCSCPCQWLGLQTANSSTHYEGSNLSLLHSWHNPTRSVCYIIITLVYKLLFKSILPVADICINCPWILALSLSLVPLFGMLYWTSLEILLCLLMSSNMLLVS